MENDKRFRMFKKPRRCFSWKLSKANVPMKKCGRLSMLQTIKCHKGLDLATRLASLVFGDLDKDTVEVERGFL
jgi:hypothetical protein